MKKKIPDRYVIRFTIANIFLIEQKSKYITFLHLATPNHLPRQII